MIRELLGVIAVILVCPACPDAAFEESLRDAASGGLADAGAGRPWVEGCPLGNPAHLAWSETIPWRVTGGRRYGIPALTECSLAGGTRVRGCGVGWGVSRMGDDRYRELVPAVSVGFPAGGMACGVRVRLAVLQVADLETAATSVVDVGSLVRVTPGTHLGLLASDLTPGGRGPGRAVSGPGMVLAVSHRTPGGIWVLLDAEQRTARPRRTRLAFEVPVGSCLRVRAGRMTQPGQATFGVGVRSRRIRVDLCVLWHSVLGLSWRTSVGFGRVSGWASERGME